jgi:hypothetical protein
MMKNVRKIKKTANNGALGGRPKKGKTLKNPNGFPKTLKQRRGKRKRQRYYPFVY